MYTKYTEQVKNVLAKTDLENFNLAIDKIILALENRTQIYLFGNGGSSATASHFIVDWRKNVSLKLGFYPNVVSLTDNTPLMTAIANDIDYSKIFSEQLQNCAKSGELALAISGSGNSSNVINGVLMANQLGLETISLTGFDGGEVGKLSNLNCRVNSNDIKIVEDLHSIFGHAVVSGILNL
jgi:D-sedoheptulose 7-phosphate isomerase